MLLPADTSALSPAPASLLSGLPSVLVAFAQIGKIDCFNERDPACEYKNAEPQRGRSVNVAGKKYYRRQSYCDLQQRCRCAWCTEQPSTILTASISRMADIQTIDFTNLTDL